MPDAVDSFTCELSYKLVNPLNENFVFVASNKGFWRSLDGGSTWDSGMVGLTTLPLVSGDITDAVMDPANPSILYIGQRGFGLYKSTNSGDSWELMLPWSKASSPLGSMIKIAIGHRGSDVNRAVAVKFDQEIFVNYKAGRPEETWRSMGKYGGDGQAASNYDWDHVIAIDPFDDDVILAGAQTLFHKGVEPGIDGASGPWWPVAGYDPVTTFPLVGGIHPDQQSIMFDPKRRNRVYLCNDGGVFLSDDGGWNWSDLNHNLVTAQFWNVGVSYDTALSGMYHQGIVGSKYLTKRQWSGLEGGSWEWSNIFGDPVRPGTFYIYNPKLCRKRFSTSTVERPPVVLGSFEPTRDEPALAVDPRLTSNTLLVGTKNPGSIMRTKNINEEIPKDWNSEPGISIPDEAIVSIAFAPSTPGMAYAVSVTGKVFRKVNVNSEAKWEEMGSWAADGVRQIAVNALHDDHLYLITSDYRDNKDRIIRVKSKIARSDTSGMSWTEVPGLDKDTRLPDCHFYSILAHRYDGRTILLGGDAGVFISIGEGLHWYTYDTNLPNAQVQELFWSEDHLYASTYGRGLWRRRVPYLG